MNNDYNDLTKEKPIEFKLNQGEDYSDEKNNLEFVSNLILENFNECPDDQNYSFLAMFLILWIKNNAKNITIEIKDLTNWKLLINKSISKTEIRVFSAIFSELTLQKINFIDSEVSGYYFVTFQF